MNLQRRMAAGLLAVGALVAASGSPATAADKVVDFRMPFEYTVPGWDNPCTPAFDDITMTTSGVVAWKVWQAEDGSVRAHSHVHMHLAGEAADGTAYVGANHFTADNRIEGPVSSFVGDSKTRLTSQGAGPNFYVRYKSQGSLNMEDFTWTFEILKDQLECRG